MTPDEIKRVREAANDVLINHDAYDDEILLLARFVLAETREDGGDAVTEQWLREEWGFRDDCCWESDDEDVEASLVDSGCYKCIEPNGVLTWCDYTGLTLGRDGETETIVEFPVKTRRKFRQLASALGIQPREQEGK